MKNLRRLACLLVVAVAMVWAQVTVGTGLAADGYGAWGHAGMSRRLGVEIAAQRNSSWDVPVTPMLQEGRRAETIEAGGSVDVIQVKRLTLRGSGGVAREYGAQTAQFLYPEPSVVFGFHTARWSPYLATTATVRIWRGLHGYMRASWRTNADFQQRQTWQAGLAWRWQ